MAIQQEAMFEAPIAHETGGHPTSEFEYEAEGFSHSSAEQEDEAQADRMLGNILGGIFGEGESEAEAFHALNTILGEDEWEHAGTSHLAPNPYTIPEMEDEADPFIGRLFRRIKGFARRITGFLPGIIRRVARAIPIVGPLAGRLASTLIREAEMEVEGMERHFVNMLAQTGELEHPQVHEAFLTELMAGQAAMAESESEAEAIIAATIPLIMRQMGAIRTVLPVAPAVVQTNVRLVRAFRQQGPRGRQLLRLQPTILRHAIAILRHAARIRRLTTPMAVQAVSIAANRALRNPRRVERALQRNVALQVRATQTRPRGRLPLRPSPRRRVPTW